MMNDTDSTIPTQDGPTQDGPATEGPIAVPADPPTANPDVHTDAPLKDMGDGADVIGGKRSLQDTLKDEAGKLGSQAADKARGFAEEGKERATGALDDFARMMHDAAGTVDEKLGDQYGHYARSAAGAVSGFADTLREKQVEDLIDDARDFVKKSPVMAIGAAAALGFVLARIIKSGIDSVADAAEGDQGDAA